jgi:phosphoribosylglycinamide formyltransferase-1
MLTEEKTRLGVLVSGGGTNLQSIIDATETHMLDAEVALVFSNHSSAFGLERARRHSIPTATLDRNKYETARFYDHALLGILQEHAVDVVVMAGYMRLLGREVLAAYPDRVVNIHPALLPSFPGANGIHDAFDYGVKVTGVTVHFATEEYDAGAIIAQETVPVEEDDTSDTLEARIHEVEHRLYPAALQLLVQDRLRIEGRRVRVLAAP